MTGKAVHHDIRSAVRDLVWPGIPEADGAFVASLLLQLETSQWLDGEALKRRQLEQAQRLLAHAHATVPWYRKRWKDCYDPRAPLTPERLRALPVLRRADVQRHFAELQSRQAPAAHGRVTEVRSSGSTGTPVRVLRTALAGLFWNALTLRDHRWHRRDLGGKLAALRHGVPEGEFAGWGPATALLHTTGPCVVRGVKSSIAEQLQWLREADPDYLLTYPSIAGELAALCRAEGISPGRLRELRTFGETLSEETRELCRSVFGVPVTDMYSAEEVGYMALQCPDAPVYHVQSEAVILEVVDESGRPCRPGETGRVLVTPLHNFAMPLVRYEIGDYAEVGPPCPCGRGLPVLKRIAGRVRNTLVTASGERYWPAFGSRSLAARFGLRQHRFVQTALDRIEARLVAERPLGPEEETEFRRRVLERLPPGFRVDIVYCREIPRSPNGKFEDFICEVAAPRA